MKYLSIILLAAAAFAQPERGVSTRPNDSSSNTNPSLTAAQVDAVLQAAAKSINAGMAIAVTDRQGDVLGVYDTGAPPTSIGNLGTTVNTYELAIALARTTSFFSNDQAPLTSRTVRFISASHFPPGIMYEESGPLYGIENTNRGCSFNLTTPAQPVPASTLTFIAPPFNGQSPATLAQPNTPGLGILTGKANLLDTAQLAVNPGSVPLYIGSTVVGGVGVAGIPANQAEYAALIGAVGGGVPPPAKFAPFTDVIFLGGVALPGVALVDQVQPPGTSPGPGTGSYVYGNSGPKCSGSVGTVSANGLCARPAPNPDPYGYLAGPYDSKIGGLTAAEVDGIVQNAIATANITRAAIRLPAGVPAKMAIAVSDMDGTLLAVYRMFDGTIFSIDVAVAKSRNVIYFTEAGLPGLSPGTAVTNRTIGFGAQPFYPSGIDYTPPGPFYQLYVNDVANPCTQGGDSTNPQNQSGIVFFPGSVPLYKGNTLVGGLGVSGDGVDQDDFVTNGGLQGYAAPSNITADNFLIRDVRLPYLKFPRNPTIP